MLTLAWVFTQAVCGRLKAAQWDAVSTLLGVGYIYALMFADKYTGAYAAVSLDYSTHTALALVFVTTLVLSHDWVKRGILLSLLMYGGLMLYQGYHSWLDIALTTLMTLPVLLRLKAWSQGRAD
ncbi:hypothetical protein [Vibrio tubiashii]|uniref:hypothetical protein n=1 Tax=Vibrio tubiashii TaxID=29498 RepID=UPI001F493E4D|nr:hypothetical protein [Vibrio tubiashii]